MCPLALVPCAPRDQRVPYVRELGVYVYSVILPVPVVEPVVDMPVLAVADYCTRPAESSS